MEELVPAYAAIRSCWSVLSRLKGAAGEAHARFAELREGAADLPDDTLERLLIVAGRKDAWCPTISEVEERAHAFLDEGAESASRIPRHSERGVEANLGEPVR